MSDFLFLPFEHAAVPPEGVVYHYLDRWWSVHPDVGLAFFRPRVLGRRTLVAPQCNSDERVATKLCSVYGADLGLEIMYVPSVFIELDADGEIKIRRMVEGITR